MKKILFFFTVYLTTQADEVPILSRKGFHDPFFDEAMVMWQNYNSEQTDIKLLHELLEKSAGEYDNPDAMAKLGEFWLLGLPIAQQTQYQELPEFLTKTETDVKFKRDFERAVGLFKQAMAKRGSDGPFFLQWLLQQTMVVKMFDGLLYEYEDVPSAITYLYDRALCLRSDLAQYTQIKRHITWNREKSVKSILNTDSESPSSFYELPISYCPSCDEIVDGANFLAEEVQESQKTVGVQISRFDRSYYDEEPTVEITRKLLEDLANTGDEDAGMKLAKSKLHGDPSLKIERNATEAVNLYEKLAQDTGNVNSHSILGVLYSKGVGTEVDVSKAIDHLLIASASGVPSAFHTFGYILDKGIGDVPRNQTKATAYMQKAAELGSIEAIANLGLQHLNGDGVEKDLEKATEYLRMAAEGGDTESAYNLGQLIYNDTEENYDCPAAVDMFNEVYRESDISRFMHFAHSFFEAGDFEGAYLNYALASSLGFFNAGLNLAYMFENDLLDNICSQSSIVCKKQFLLQTAHLSGSNEAFVRLGDIYWSEEDPTIAFSFYSAASAHPKGLYSMGVMHSMGVGTSHNYTAAEECFFAIIDGAWRGEFDWRTSVPAVAGLLALYAFWKLYWILRF